VRAALAIHASLQILTRFLSPVNRPCPRVVPQFEFLHAECTKQALMSAYGSKPVIVPVR
jgi:hypothetical protein